jgi:hypothetical protein
VNGDRDRYAARLLFQGFIDHELADDALLEERIVLIRTASMEEANAEAHRYGVRGAHEYQSERGKTVSWHLHSVADVAIVADPQEGSGWSVMSRYLRPSKDFWTFSTAQAERFLTAWCDWALTNLRVIKYHTSLSDINYL